MCLACAGYLNLNLTEHEFRDIIEREINGELICIGINKSSIHSNVKKTGNYPIRRTRRTFFGTHSGTNGYFEEEIGMWNCSHAAKVMRNCYTKVNEQGKSLKNLLFLIQTFEIFTHDHRYKHILWSCLNIFLHISEDRENRERVRACDLAVTLKKQVDDAMIFLIVMFACLLNTILQSLYPLFQGKSLFESLI